MLLEELFNYRYVIVYLDGQVCQQRCNTTWECTLHDDTHDVVVAL